MLIGNVLIGNTMIDEENVLQLLKDIKKKKELQNLSEDFIREQLSQFLQQDRKAATFLADTYSRRSVRYKSIIKQLRARLRKWYGLYRRSEDSQRLHELVEMLVERKGGRKVIDQALIRTILATNSSTRERLPCYEELYEQLFKITGRPRSIIDLGCGINPFSIPLLPAPWPGQKLTYQAFDLNEDEIALLQEFFEHLHSLDRNFKGSAKVLDALHFAALLDLKKVDICFLFKMTDVLDRGKGHTATEAVIHSVPARWVVVSFPTKTMSGKRMTAPKRNWMDWLCRRRGYQYTLLEFKNELFYVVKK